MDDSRRRKIDEQFGTTFSQDFIGATIRSGDGGGNSRGGDIGSHNIVVANGGTLLNVNSENIISSIGVLRVQLQPAPHAGILEDKACLEGTRTRTLDDISKWFHTDNGSRVFFLVGGAGTGKSSIAHAMGRRFQAHLGSFFCFNRSFQAVRPPESLFRSIAYDLCEWNSSFRQALNSIIKERPSAINITDIRSQWNNLILEPAKHLVDPVLLIIDAMDESGDTPSRRLLLTFLTQHVAALPSNFRVVVTSRSEPDIMAAVRKYLRPEDLLNLDDQKAEATQDIGSYIRNRFENECYEVTDIPDSFYRRLLEKADGLFVWAFTACEWMLGPECVGLTLDERFDNLLGTAGDVGPGLEPLDALYSSILTRAFSTQNSIFMARFRSVMGQTLSSSEPLSMNSLNELRRLATGSAYDEISHILLNMGSLLLGVADRDNRDVPVRPHHTSFRDFLTTQSRSQKWYINISDKHALMALGCFRVMNKGLFFNFCHLPSSFLSNDDMLASNTKKDTIIQLLAYACRFWADHLCDILEDSMLREVILFMTEKLLAWFEALSVLQTVHKAVPALHSLEKLLIVHQDGNNPASYIGAIVKDAIKFMRYFAPAIAYSAPHIYISALPFAPNCSKVAQLYASKFRNTISLKIGQLPSWPAQQAVLAGHTSIVTSVAFSPDGKHIVSGSYDTTVQIWDAETGQAIGKALEGHSDSVQAVAYTPDGKCIVSASMDKTVCIWDAETRQAIQRLLNEHVTSDMSIMFSPDGKLAIFHPSDNAAQTQNTETAEQPEELLEKWPKAVIALSPNRRHFISGSTDNKIWIWDKETKQVLGGPLEGHINWISSVAYSPDGKCIVSGSHNWSVRIWDAEPGQTIRQSMSDKHTAWIKSIAISPDGKYIVSGSFDMTIHIWDAETGESMGESLKGHIDVVTAVAFSPDGKYIISGSDDMTIQIWEAETGQPVGLPLGHMDGVTSVVFSPDGKYIVGSSDNIIQIWDMETRQTIGKPLEGHTEWITSIVFSPNGKYIISASTDRSIRIWDVGTMKSAGEPLQGHTDSVISVAFSYDGRYIASGSEDKTIRIWDIASGKTVLGPLEGHMKAVRTVALSYDGRYIVSGSEDETIRVWNAETGKIVGEPLTGHTHWVMSVIFSPDGKRIISGSADNTIRIWDADTEHSAWEALDECTGLAAFSADDKHVNASSGMEENENTHLVDNQFLANHFYLRSDGWACGPRNELLFWVPPLHRLCLHSPRTAKVIGPHETAIDFSRVAWGTKWIESACSS